MQIAVDGPAGAGKSTVAKDVAAELQLKYVDTGAMYRALAVALADAGIDAKNTAAVLRALPALQMEVAYDGREQLVRVNGRDLTGRIRTAEAAAGASDVAVIPEVRQKLTELQRRTAANYDVVMDGRDIGTCVLPDADFKFYLTASPRSRAERRQRDLLALGRQADVDEIEAEIAERDRQDMNREEAPLRRVPEQILIDTTDLTQREAADRMLAVIRGEA